MKTAAFSAAELRFGAGYPGPRICRTFTRKGAAVSSQGLPEIAGPLGEVAPQSRVRRSSLAFGAACPTKTTFFLISRVKPVFTKRRRLGDEKSLLVRRFVACFFARPERNWRCRRGKSPPPRNPGRPAAARPTTATGSRFLRRQRERPPRRPRPSPPAREGALGAPQRPNLFGRRLPESPKGKGKGKEEARMERAPPL